MARLVPFKSTIGKYPGWKKRCIYLGVESVTVPVPALEELDLIASGLGPWITISQWGVNCERDDAKD